MKRLISALILREIPVLSKLVGWITDPKMVARKRTIVTFLSTFAAGLIAAKGLIAFVCASAVSDFAMAVCRIDVEKIAVLIGGLIDLINRPEVGAVGFVSGVWALVSGYRKHAKENEQVNG
jgi:hypothetical protein